MDTKPSIRSMACLLAVALAALGANPIYSLADDATDVEQASTRFYDSLNSLFTGDVSPMQAIWSHTDDVTYMGPAGGIQVGWDEVRANWDAQAALKLGGKVEPRDTHITIGEDLAIVQCYEVGFNMSAQETPLAVSIRATNIFRKENGQWKMIGHHTDLLGFLNEETRTKAQE